MPRNLLEWQELGDKVFQTEIEIEFVHNLKDLYKFLWQHYVDEGWNDFNNLGEFETLYWQRDLPNGMQEHQIYWRLWKHPEQGTSPYKYFTYFIKFNWQTIAVTRSEVMHKGKKWKLYQSNTILRIEGWLLYDEYDKGWEKGLIKGLKHRYHKWIIKDKVKWQQEALLKYMHDQASLIKRYLSITAQQEPPKDIYSPDMLPR